MKKIALLSQTYKYFHVFMTFRHFRPTFLLINFLLNVSFNDFHLSEMS